MQHIYLDHAAATPMLPEVFEEMRPYFIEEFGNPSSVHSKGQKARRAVDISRRTVAEILNCDPREIIFTGSGTESDNLAIQGICCAYESEVRERNKTPHIITSQAEHSAVLNTIEYLEKNHEFDVTYLAPNEFGVVSAKSVENAIRDETIFCSIMYANNEVGAINPVAEIAKVCHANGRFGQGVIFHTDACQAGGSLNLNIEELGVDLMTLNGSKIYGPKGVGILYRRKGLQLVPMIFGGEGQEHRLRAGTENVPAIVGIAKALKIAEKFRSSDERRRMCDLRDFLVDQLLKIPDSFLNGPMDDAPPGSKRLPNNVNISFAGIDGAALLIKLDQEGIYATSGSACTSGSLDPSHVLLAIGRTEKLATGAIRLSLGRETTKEELWHVIEVVTQAVAELRESSPIY